MRSLYVLFFVCLLISSCKEETITANDVLEKSIAYHDPSNGWASFKGEFNVVMQTPNSSDRSTSISIDLPSASFLAIAKQDSSVVSYIINNGKCVVSAKDSVRIANLKTKPKRSHCETTTLYKDYYTYLYGLPMKLKDPGTHIDPEVTTKTFKDKEYLVIKASYDEAVGTDVWYFYFDPVTYAMEVYQFYKTDEDGTVKPDSGEYILLTEESVVNNIKMPKVRAWYYNKDDGYLGTDILK